MQRSVWATDISDEALAATAANAARLGAAVELIRCDLCAAVADRSLDLLVSNPPYIPLSEEDGLPREVRDYEPRLALFGGPEGLDAYRRLVAEGARVLRPGGWAVLEIGYQQSESVSAMFGRGWHNVEVGTDLAGLPRVVTACRAA